MSSIQTFSEWLSSSDTGNIGHDLAVTFAQLSTAQSDTLRTLKAQLDDRTTDLEAINALQERIRKYLPVKDGDKDATLATKGGFGETKEESISLIDQLEGWGVEIGEEAVDETQTPYQASKETMNQWLTSLNTASEGVSSDISQLETKIQAAMDQWSKNEEWTATMIGKLGEILKVFNQNSVV